MFGMGFGELVLVIIVAVIAIGPKDMPRVLRTLGQWAGRLRRMALDLRVQSGIDDVLRNEGLADDIQEIRKLARGELDGIRQAATIDLGGASAAVSSATNASGANASSTLAGGVSANANANANEPAYPDVTTHSSASTAPRPREYPREGADAYDAMPDTAIVYVDALTRSPLARDPLYVLGDPDGVLPPEPAPAPEPTPAPAALTPSTDDAPSPDEDRPMDAKADPADKSDSIVPTKIGMPVVPPTPPRES